jgi:hypothetical protein
VASHVAKAILYALASRADSNGECWPSIATLCRDSGLTERAVQHHLGLLADQRHLIRTARRGKPTIFRLTLNDVSTGARHAPPHTDVEGGARRAPYPRTRCPTPPQAMHPKLQEKEPRNKNEVRRDESSTAASASLDMRRSANWWTTNAGIDSKAREIGVASRPGESYDDLKTRVNIALKTPIDRQ